MKTHVNESHATVQRKGMSQPALPDTDQLLLRKTFPGTRAQTVLRAPDVHLYFFRFFKN